MLAKKQLLHDLVPPSESAKKKKERDTHHREEKKKAMIGKAKRMAKRRHQLKMRTYKYDAAYRRMEADKIQKRREATAKGGFYINPQPKVLFAIRLKGINKLAPKPKMILRLFRLRQIHNGVFIRVNKATTEMLKTIEPFITYGYPSLSTIRKLIYKRGYAKVGPKGAHQRKKLISNDIISKHLGGCGMHGMEDLVHEIYTCGPNFKRVTNFLWPFKLSSPRKGFKCKRHGFSEARGGDWGPREEAINELIRRMN